MNDDVEQLVLRALARIEQLLGALPHLVATEVRRRPLSARDRRVLEALLPQVARSMRGALASSADILDWATLDRELARALTAAVGKESPGRATALGKLLAR